ncbi:hypothetical protein RJ55_02806 [Drechmeria coniospora]|nr:hypothetical protein RJ55_02806 [Drechmeria coniospora]
MMVPHPRPAEQRRSRFGGCAWEYQYSHKSWFRARAPQHGTPSSTVVQARSTEYTSVQLGRTACTGTWSTEGTDTRRLTRQGKGRTLRKYGPLRPPGVEVGVGVRGWGRNCGTVLSHSGPAHFLIRRGDEESLQCKQSTEFPRPRTRYRAHMYRTTYGLGNNVAALAPLTWCAGDDSTSTYERLPKQVQNNVTVFPPPASCACARTASAQHGPCPARRAAGTRCSVQSIGAAAIRGNGKSLSCRARRAFRAYGRRASRTHDAGVSAVGRLSRAGSMADMEVRCTPYYYVRLCFLLGAPVAHPRPNPGHGFGGLWMDDATRPLPLPQPNAQQVPMLPGSYGPSARRRGTALLYELMTARVLQRGQPHQFVELRSNLAAHHAVWRVKRNGRHLVQGLSYPRRPDSTRPSWTHPSLIVKIKCTYMHLVGDTASHRPAAKPLALLAPGLTPTSQQQLRHSAPPTCFILPAKNPLLHHLAITCPWVKANVKERATNAGERCACQAFRWHTLSFRPRRGVWLRTATNKPCSSVRLMRIVSPVDTIENVPIPCRRRHRPARMMQWQLYYGVLARRGITYSAATCPNAAQVRAHTQLQ